MVATDAFPGASGVVDSLDARRDLAGLIARTTTGVPRAGVMPRTSAGLVSSTSSTGPMTVNVASADFVLVRDGGVLFMQNNGSYAVTIATAPVSNSRIDVVYVKQNESAAPMSDGSDTPVIAAVTGTAAASPVKPSIPVGALELATVEVPSGVASTAAGGVVITQTYPFTSTTGSPVVIRDSSELAAWGGPNTSEAIDLSADAGGSYLRHRRVGGDWVQVVYPWTTLTAGSGWTANTGSVSPQVMRFESVVYFRGGLFGGTANTTATTLPSWARPSRDVRVPFVTNLDTVGLVRVLTTGALRPSAGTDGDCVISWSVA